MRLTFFIIFFLLLSCGIKNKKKLENAVWAIEEVEVRGEVYGVESLSDNLLRFDDDGGGSGFIFANSPHFYNYFYWDFYNAEIKGQDSIEVYNSNNEFFNDKFHVRFFTKNGGYFLVLTSNDLKVRCFKWL